MSEGPTSYFEETAAEVGDDHGLEARPVAAGSAYQTASIDPALKAGD